MIFEARMAIETHAAELAAKKATKADIDLIRAAYEDMVAARKLEDILEPDIRFHQAIMDATHNDVIRYIGHTLHNALSMSIKLTSWSTEIHIASLPRHKAIFLAIANRDGKAALKATQNLLKESRKDFDSRKKGKN